MHVVIKGNFENPGRLEPNCGNSSVRPYVRPTAPSIDIIDFELSDLKSILKTGRGQLQFMQTKASFIVRRRRNNRQVCAIDTSVRASFLWLPSISARFS